MFAYSICHSVLINWFAYGCVYAVSSHGIIRPFFLNEQRTVTVTANCYVEMLQSFVELTNFPNVATWGLTQKVFPHVSTPVSLFTFRCIKLFFILEMCGAPSQVSKLIFAFFAPLAILTDYVGKRTSKAITNRLWWTTHSFILISIKHVHQGWTK